MAVVDVSSSDGTLSPPDFVSVSHAFVHKWNSITHDLPPWSWISCKSTPLASSYQVDGYLALEKMCVFWSAEANNGEDIDSELGKPSCFCGDEDLEDDGTLVEASDQSTCEVHYYDFHIIYSSSYRVPVLYFRGYRSVGLVYVTVRPILFRLEALFLCVNILAASLRSFNLKLDGQLLPLDEIEKDLPASSAKVLTESKWTFITQMEHPYMNRPWFMLHPCGTNELMRLLLEGDKLAMSDQKYLISWLSVVGQVVGIKVPLQMGVLAPQ